MYKFEASDSEVLEFLCNVLASASSLVRFPIQSLGMGLVCMFMLMNRL